MFFFYCFTFLILGFFFYKISILLLNNQRTSNETQHELIARSLVKFRGGGLEMGVAHCYM